VGQILYLLGHLEPVKEHNGQLDPWQRPRNRWSRRTRAVGGTLELGKDLFNQGRRLGVRGGRPLRWRDAGDGLLHRPCQHDLLLNTL
jgi:hypothetical protein